MTTPPVDPEAPEDMKDADPGGLAPSDEHSDAEDDSDGTDAMGINEDDPIDATLVGSPVDDDNAADRPSAPSGSDPDADDTSD